MTSDYNISEISSTLNGQLRRIRLWCQPIPDVPYPPEELIASGYKARKERHPEQATEIFSEAVQLSRKAADTSLLASSLVGLGQIECDPAKVDVSLQY